jgi:hypothetical protein
VVRLVALGRTNAEISAELCLCLSTVKTHLGSAQTKLGARNRVEIAAWAWSPGWSPAPDTSVGPGPGRARVDRRMEGTSPSSPVQNSPVGSLSRNVEWGVH